MSNNGGWRLWFDVEKRYNTTELREYIEYNRLWFDVEKRYNTTSSYASTSFKLLWFDVEKRYNTTHRLAHQPPSRCGLM